jgi:hypothetical protein
LKNGKPEFTAYAAAIESHTFGPVGTFLSEKKYIENGKAIVAKARTVSKSKVSWKLREAMLSQLLAPAKAEAHNSPKAKGLFKLSTCDDSYKKLRASLPKAIKDRVADPLIFSSDPDKYEPKGGYVMTMGEYRKLLIKSWSFPTLGGFEPTDWNEKDEILSSFLRAHVLNPTAMFCLHRHDTLDAEEIKAMMKELYSNPDYLPHLAALPSLMLRCRVSGVWICLYSRSEPKFWKGLPLEFP